MLILTKPVNQERLNAAVVEVVGLNVMGPVCIPGEWDAHEVMRYIEVKLKQPHTLYFVTDDDSNNNEGNNNNSSSSSIMYQVTDKLVHFTKSQIYIYPNETEQQLHQ
jgi:hypothetical protein